MAERMAQIEQRTAAALRLVLGDDLGLGAATPLDRMQAGRRIALEDSSPMRLQPIEEGRVAQETVFRRFRIAGAQFAHVQRIQHIGVDQHQARLMEGADKVLAVPGVDAGLAADGGVHLGEQRRRDLHQADAALQDAGGESGKVADDAAAERDDDIAAIEPQVQQRVA